MSRGAYKRSERPSEPSVTDSRGRVVRSVGKTQTFLSIAEVDELVALYEQGMTLVQLGERFGVYHRTVAAHLVRRSVPMRVRGLAEEHTSEAVRLYEGGMTLMEVGLHFGVSQGAVKRAVAAGATTALGDVGCRLQREVLLGVLGLVLGDRQHDAELGSRGKGNAALPDDVKGHVGLVISASMMWAKSVDDRLSR